MRSRFRMVFLMPAALALNWLGAGSAEGQTAPPARTAPRQYGAAQTGVGYGFANPMIVDPVAMNYLYATGVPMTRGQVGLSAVSSMQRMTGIGSGRLSGVRGGEAVQEEPRRSATHTRNSNIPGGQASGFFNRVGTSIPTTVPASASAGNSQRFYGRQGRYFPRPAR